MKLIKTNGTELSPWTEFDRLFERSFPLMDSMFVRPAPSNERGIPFNGWETDEARHVELELPGVKKEDVNLDVEGGVLSVTATRKTGRGDNSGELKYRRALTVGDDIDADGIKARLEDGILRVELPKAEAARARTITIE